MNKTIDTLIPDIYKLFEEGKALDEENLNNFCRNLYNTLSDRFAGYGKKRKPTLRMSNVGRKDRQLYYELSGKYDITWEPDPALKLRFLYGDILEELLILLAREAGHKVEDEQKTVKLEGVTGHIDCKIDDVLVDVKSASKFAFKKFSENTLRENDGFGYINQITGYAEAEGFMDAAFLAINKETGDLALLNISADEVAMENTSERIKDIKEVLASDDLPEKCYEAIPHGKSGNKKLPMQCVFCTYKEECWKDSNEGQGLRTFKYSNGPVYMTEVVDTPKVEELK